MGIQISTYNSDIGDVLWVRETWQYAYDIDDNTDHYIEGSGRYLYRADDDMPFSHWVDPTTGEHKERMPWCPSIHMPKEAARIFLRVADVRVERLQDISAEYCISEGIALDWSEELTKPSYVSLAYCETRVKPAYKDAFHNLWNSTIPKKNLDLYGWGANAFCWVIEFERCEMRRIGGNYEH